MSKVTASPTFNSSKVTPCSSFAWKNRSFASPSRAMNPNFRSVNVLMVPVIDRGDYQDNVLHHARNSTTFPSESIMEYSASRFFWQVQPHFYLSTSASFVLAAAPCLMVMQDGGTFKPPHQNPRCQFSSAPDSTANMGFGVGVRFAVFRDGGDSHAQMGCVNALHFDLLCARSDFERKIGHTSQ